MATWAAWGILVLAVLASHWGADRLAEPLQKLKTRLGFPAAAGASIIALATSSPEISTNAASALQGVSAIGLGNLLGANIISVPVIVTVAYVATRGRRRGGVRHHLLPLEENANRLQALPYLGVVALVALLTLPAPWRGLQPVDGWIMLGAYAAYLVQALLRGRVPGRPASWTGREITLAIGGVAVLVAGAYYTVRATEALVAAYGISQLVGGLFITAGMSVLPEVFATWSLARRGMITPATTSVIADNLATLTLAFFPLALVATPVEDMRLYSFNLGFVAAYAVAFVVFVRYRANRKGFELWEVLALNLLYIVYLALMLGWVLEVL